MVAFEHLRHEAGPDRHGLVVLPLEPRLQLPDTRIAWAPRSPDGGMRLDFAREMYGAAPAPA